MHVPTRPTRQLQCERNCLRQIDVIDNKTKVTTRKSCRFWTLRVFDLALSQLLG